MKQFIFISSSIISVMTFCLMFFSISCSDDDDDNGPYDLRILSSELTSSSMAALRNIQQRFENILNTKNGAIRNVDLNYRFQQNETYSTSYRETGTFEYENGAHIFYTKATFEMSDGGMRLNEQTLDDTGFPVMEIISLDGMFESASEFTYDHDLYFRTSYTEYYDDPRNYEEARIAFDTTIEWNDEGKMLSQTGVQYDENGLKVFEGKIRWIQPNRVVRGWGGSGFDEYYHRYENGVRIYSFITEFDENGMPAMEHYDNDGDGVYDVNNRFVITVENGVLIGYEVFDNTYHLKKYKISHTFHDNGLHATSTYYIGINNSWVLFDTTSYTWLYNPVGGPTAGRATIISHDANGNVTFKDEVLSWTETELKTRITNYDEYYSNQESYSAILQKVPIP